MMIENLLRIPVNIYPAYWMMALLISWVNAASYFQMLVWFWMILISILVHEYGHASTAVLFGQNAMISLNGIGGMTYRQGKSIKRWQEFLVVLNGPLASFILILCLYVIRLLPLFNWLEYITRIAFQVNVIWLILNLIPVLPLDGGHLVYIVLTAIFPKKGKKLTMLFGLFFAALLALFFLNNGALISTLIALFLVVYNYRSYVDLPRTTRSPKGFAEGVLIAPKQKSQPTQRLAHPFHEPEEIVPSYHDQIAQAMAVGDYQKVYEMLIPFENSLNMDELRMLFDASYYLNKWEDTARIGVKIYENKPDAHIAFINAFAAARLNQVDAAVGWLNATSNLGWSDYRHILDRSEFDAIRSSKQFLEFFERQEMK